MLGLRQLGVLLLVTEEGGLSQEKRHMSVRMRRRKISGDIIDSVDNIFIEAWGGGVVGGL